MKKYPPEIVALASGILEQMRALLPGAKELVHDNYNGLVIAFGSSERAGDAVFSVVLYPRWVNLFFAWGAFLPDPDGLLQGQGKRVRHVRLQKPEDFDQPGLRALLNRAIEQSGLDLAGASRTIVIKSVSPVQRPRKRADR